MVPKHVSIQKSLKTFKKMKKQSAQSHAVREIKKCRQNIQQFVTRLPYKHLLKEFALDFKSLSSEDEPLFSMLDDASQAHLTGIFDGYDNVCQSVVKKESTDFLMSLASLGLKRLVGILAEDKDLVTRARDSDHSFTRNLVNNLSMDHDHFEGDGHHHNHDDHHYNHEHYDDHNHEHHDHEEGHQHHHEPDHDEAPETLGNTSPRRDHVDEVIARIMRRISSNVTISVCSMD